MVLPIVQIIIEGDLKGRLGQFLSPLMSMLPGESLLPALCASFLTLMFLKASLKLATLFFSGKLIWKLRFEWMTRIYPSCLNAEYAFILSKRHGELVNIILGETQIAATCLFGIIEFLTKIVLLIALYVTLASVQFQVTLVMSMVAIGLGVFTHYVLSNYIRRTGSERVTLRQRMSADVTESLGAVPQIKVLGAGSWFLAKLVKAASEQYKIEVRLRTVKALPGAVGELVVAVVAVGGVLYLNARTDVALLSVLPTLAVVVLIAQRMIGYVAGLAELRLRILSTLPSASLVYKYAGELIPQEDKSTGEDVGELMDDVVLKNVSFAYTEGEPVLVDWNMRIARGQTTALVGPSGSGKSTIANLLIGLYQPQSGEILINGRRLPEWNLASWRKKTGYVSQEIILFNMSVRDNIALGNVAATEEAIISAAKVAHAHDFIKELPQGYDTRIGDRGLKLSGGERQRIAIARTLVRNPDIIIFDEATSALDDESERQVQEAMDEVSKEKTMVIIAHRLRSIEKADSVYEVGKAN